MKKIALTIAIVLGISLAGFAQGGLFKRGDEPSRNGFRETSNFPMIPGQHDYTGDVHGDGTSAPIGSGVLLLLSFGAAYALTKKRKE